MLYALLADLTLLLHLAFIIFGVFGGLLVYRKRWVAWLHIPTFIWAGLVNLTNMWCPLTPLEKYFRAHAGEPGYEGGFIAHYLLPIIYPQGVGFNLALVTGTFVLVWNVVVYGVVVYRIRRAKK